MIKVIYGPKGTGKTKVLVDTANKTAVKARGAVVFIDDSEHLILDLKHEVRFVNVSEFPPMGGEGFLGFLCGILSQNYDIEGIFIDRLNFITNESVTNLEVFFEKLKAIDKKSSVNFMITIHGSNEDMPEFLKQFA